MHDPMTLVGTIRLTRRRDLFDVWHREPGDRDSGEVCGYRGLWKHVSHLEVRFLPWRRFKRRWFTSCEWCGELGSKGDLVNVSHRWYSEAPKHWWLGERHMFHRECSSVEAASKMCTCEQPRPAGRFIIGEVCTNCKKIIDQNQARYRRARRATLRAGAHGRKPSHEDMREAHAMFKAAREGEQA